MAKLTASERKKLPDSAFVYVASSGKRLLPIPDESHVRNALSRFGQVKFESDDARAAARTKLLKAAKKYGIVPVGFIDAELQSEQRKAASGRLIIELGRVESAVELQAELRRTLDDPSLTLIQWSKPEGTYVCCDGAPMTLPRSTSSQQATFLQGSGRPLMAIVHDKSVLQSPEITEAVMAALHLVAGKELLDEADEIGVATEGLPDGDVTFLLTDIEGSTPLLQSLGRRYEKVLRDVRSVISNAVLEAGGRQVEARADEYVAVFETPGQAVTAAIAMQRAMTEQRWPKGHDVRIRVGVHSGEIVLTEAGYVGMTVHKAARIMSAAHGGQVLVSSDVRRRLSSNEGHSLVDLGMFSLRGLANRHKLLQVAADGLAADFDPPAV